MLLILGIILIIGVVTGIIKGIIKSIIGGFITLAILGLCYIGWTNHVQTPSQLFDAVNEVLPKSTSDNSRNVSNILDTSGQAVEHHQGTIGILDSKRPTRLIGDEKSSTSEGSVKYGATFVMGELDHLKRATFAHIRVKDQEEPGSNGIKRPERITTNPAGWSNINRTNDRTHLVGYQFSGINSDPRNLVTATAYLNRGVAKSGSDDKNPDGMLFYEQKLDKWLHDNKDKFLDLYVAPIYDGDNLIPTYIYMSWIGLDKNNQEIQISTGGHAHSSGNYVSVLLENKSH